jgi:hypothetical protein
LTVHVECVPPVANPGSCYVPDVWRIDPVPWNRDTGPQSKIDDLIDGDPGCRHDIIVDFRECVTPSHLEFLEPSVPPVTTSSKLFVGGLSWNTGAVVEPSSCELNFQTDGPIICQALFQRLEPRAPLNGFYPGYAPSRIELFSAIPSSGPSFMPVVITGSRIIDAFTVTFGYIADMPIRFGYIADMPIRRPVLPRAASSVNSVRNENWNFGYIADMPIRFGYIADMPIR